MGAWKHAGSPYLVGSDTAGLIEGREAWRRSRERLEREPQTQASGSELASEPEQPEARQAVSPGGGR